MAPLPKRKHSTQRKGKRLHAGAQSLPKLVPCTNCHQLKLPHRVCKNCNK